MADTPDHIADSFISLLQTNTYDNITIQMICNSTPTSRNTFYYYYDSKEKLVEWICCRDFMKYCFPYFKIQADNISVKSFFLYIKENRNFYKAVYRSDNGRLLRHCLEQAYSRGVTKESIREYGCIEAGPYHKVDFRIFCRYSNCGIAAVVLFWIENDMKMPIEEVAKDLAIMLTNSLEFVRDHHLF